MWPSCADNFFPSSGESAMRARCATYFTSISADGMCESLGPKRKVERPKSVRAQISVALRRGHDLVSAPASVAGQFAGWRRTEMVKTLAAHLTQRTLTERLHLCEMRSNCNRADDHGRSAAAGYSTCSPAVTGMKE